MLLLLAAWVVLSVVLGIVIGAAIHQADQIERRTRPSTYGDADRSPAGLPPVAPTQRTVSV